MRDVDDHTGPASGRPSQDEDVLPLSTSRHNDSVVLRQQTLHQYAVPVSSGRAQSRGSPTTVTQESVITSHRHSVLWGDPHVSGNKVERDSLFRVLSHNVNGLSTADDHADVRNFAASIQEKSVSLFGIQETNRNFERPTMVSSFHNLLRGVSVQHKGAVSSAKLQWPSNYQPGGTAVSVRNQWATRLLDKGSDVQGRWSWLTLAGSGRTKITCISCYRVCDGASQAPITARTARSQQEWMNADRGATAVNLRDHFISDLAALILANKAKGHDIILMMDANEACGNGSGVDRLLLCCGLVDAHTLSSDSTPPPATYQRGSAKIDFIMVTPRLVQAVRAATILPLHDGYLSDHRALIVDFDAKALFASTTSPVLPPTSRRLTSTNPKALHIYIEHMGKHIAVHGLIDKVAELQAISEKGNWSEAEVKDWEIIDNLLEQGRAAAEAKCPSKRSGTLPWSPELNRAGKQLRYWQMRTREFTSRYLNYAQLERLAAEVNIPSDEQEWLPSATVHTHCRKARKALKEEVKKDAASLRTLHLEATARLSATLHKMSDEAAVSAIAAREKSSRQFKQLRSIFKSGMSSGFDRLDIPDLFAVRREGEETPRIPLVVKEEIEEVLLPHTEKRFRQHQETPFGKGTRKSGLGIDCTSDDVTALCDGSYDRELETLSVEARTWLCHLKSRDFVNAGGVISVNLSSNDFITGWSKMRESTASAPGAGHYGHYKSASVAARLPSDHPDHNKDLASIYATMWSLPLRHGFAPRRWRSCVDAIIEKIPGKPMIEKLRIIMLYEADFNFVLKLIWGKRLVRHAEFHKCLGNSNHGSRPGRQTFDALLEKLMVYEIARLSRTSVVTVDNDAKSCYDRIIKTLSMVACMGVGLPQSTAIMHNRTHHAMEHHIKSSHGTFRPYSGSDEDELEGTGQGSGGSPAIWLIYNACLLEAFSRFTKGIHLPSPYEDLVVQILAIFYVDDGMPGVNDALQREAEKLAVLLQQAEEASQSWERLLFASGGALELSKCFAYIVYWDLSEGGHRMIEPSEINGCVTEGDHFSGPISLTYGEESTMRHSIVTESPSKGRRTLGVRIAPCGNWDDELKYRSTQARELALLMAGSEMSRDTARVAYRSMICPKLEYPLAVTQFSQKECDKIVSPVLRVCLSKMGYNSNMPREVVYGPTELGGLAFHDYFIEQGIAQVKMLVGHYRQDSETARMIEIERQWCQVQAGTAVNLLASPQTPIDYIESCWFMCLRSFLCTYDLSIEFTQNVQPTTTCLGDEFIMDALRLSGSCTTTELQRLNACRMYVQVTRLSDITSADGLYLRTEMLQGSHNGQAYFVTNDRWPRQERPPKSWWSLWRKKLKVVFSLDGASSRLRNPLGEWLLDSLQVIEWDVLVSTDLSPNEVYVLREDGDYDVHPPLSACRSGRLRVRAVPSTVVDSVPWCVVPATLGRRDNKGYCKVSSRGFLCPRSPTNAATDPPTSLAGYVAQQPTHIQRMLRHCDLTDKTAEMLVGLVYAGATLDSGTDGGLLNGLGTFGFVWGDPSTEAILAQGRGHVDGASCFMSSTRTELGGILAALTYLRLVIEHFRVVMPQRGLNCTVHCDSQAALRRVESLSFEGFGTTWRCRENYDLEAAIRQCLQKRPLCVNWKWIRGHASRRKKREDFSRAEILNDAADELATEARGCKSDLINDHWPEQVVSVVAPTGRLTGRLGTAIRYCCTAPDMLSYWKDRYSWSNAQVALVDTVSIRVASSKLCGDSASRVQKLRCGWLPINSREARIDPDRLPGCAACSTTAVSVAETVDHLFQCTERSRRRAVAERFEALHDEFRAWKTSEIIISTIRAGAMAWVEGKATPSLSSLNLPDTTLGRLTAKAYLDQTLLGWNALFRGFWASSWRLAQEHQFTCYPIREKHDTGDRWAGLAQSWFISLFELLWGLRNENEHGVDSETQLLIRLATCERAIRRLYNKSEELPDGERHPFRTPMEELLQTTVHDQELWIKKTEDYLPKAFRRARKRTDTNQSAITDFFVRL